MAQRMEGLVEGERRLNPITWRLLLRVLTISSIVCGFISLVVLFNGPLMVTLNRVAHIFAYGWLGAIFGMLAARFAARIGLARRGYLIWGVATGVIMALPQLVVVWTGETVLSLDPVPLRAFPNVVWDTLLFCIGASVLAMLAMRGVRPSAKTAAPPKFLERLPLKLRGCDLWAVEAEDHYLRLHTSKGQDLILLRLADAIAELDGIEGAQVHRSWWVARDAIAEAERGDGRATLTLKDGSQVPVSRTYAKMLRDRNWI
jgi:DNA-binding LytR/AlgR family response regulator